MCDSELVGEAAHVRWCERCDWNVDPLHHGSGPLGADEQVSVARARTLYEVALAQGPEGLPRRGASFALFALVLPLFAFHLVALVAGIVVFTGSSSLVWRFVAGGPLVLLGLMPVLHRTATQTELSSWCRASIKSFSRLWATSLRRSALDLPVASR